jgi:hypothetical protein
VVKAVTVSTMVVLLAAMAPAAKARRAIEYFMFDGIKMI